jgi:hypothetical protein
MRGRASLAVVVIIVAGCTTGAHRAAPTVPITARNTGLASGRMHISGGPGVNGRVPDSPLPGVVEVVHPFSVTVLLRVTVGKSGVFRIAVTAGKYQLVGRPTNTGIASFRSREFSVVVGHTTTVDLVDLAT